MDEAGVDMDIDQCLIGKFSSLGTTDKDVLIDEFRKLLGFQLNAAGCEFFLDMTNWNLHAAIGAYYDFEMPSTKLPSMTFIKDVTIGEGEAVSPNTEFIKTWKIENSGREQWPLGCTLRFVNGDKMSAADWVSVESLSPKHSIDVSVRMRSPGNTGIYQGQWKIYTKNMVPFGDTIWVVISVEVGGLLGVTQQFANTLGTPSNSTFDSQLSVNPFLNQTGSHPIQNGADGCHQDMDMGEKLDTSSRSLTNTPELRHVSAPPPSGACWNSRSPTMIYGPVDRLSGASHSLHSIDEERGNFPKPNEIDSNFGQSSSSSYDLCARQMTPCNSPSHLLQLEQSFNSPDAPSPIRPAVQSNISQNSYTSAQKLDF